MKRNTGYNSTYKKLAVQYSADTFVVNQTLVLRIKFCGENRQLLVAANRYKQGYNRADNENEISTDKRQKPTHKVNKEALPSTTKAQCHTIALFSTRKQYICRALQVEIRLKFVMSRQKQ